jgi:hypothetical protein
MRAGWDRAVRQQIDERSEEVSARGVGRSRSGIKWAKSGGMNYARRTLPVPNDIMDCAHHLVIQWGLRSMRQSHPRLALSIAGGLLAVP